MPEISPEVLLKGKELVDEAGTGWDYYSIRQQFSAQLVNGFSPDNVNGAFLGFVKKKVNCSTKK